jgi:two-component system sensor histidine kinase YesM
MWLLLSWTRRIGIFPKLVITYMLTIVPLYVISLQMNHMGSEIVKGEILNSMETRVHFYLSSFEAEIQRTMRLQMQFIVDDDLLKLSTMIPQSSYYDLYESLLSQQRLQNQLLLMQNSSQYIDQARVYILTLNRTLLGNSIQNGISDEKRKEFQSYSEKKMAIPVLDYSNGHILLRSTPHEISNSNKPPDFVIEAEISQLSVEQFLKRMTYRGDEGVMLADDLGRWQLSNNNSDQSVSKSVMDMLQQENNKRIPYGQLNIKVNHTKYLISYEHSSVLGASMIQLVPEKQILGPLNKYNFWIWWLSGLSFFVVILFSYWIYRIIRQPLKKLVLSLRKVEKGDLTISINHQVQDEFHYLYQQFNSMVYRIKELIEENYESQIIAQRLELKQLQSQINPHFLYNTYFMVNLMAESQDLKNVQTATQYLGEYFLYITRNSSDEVTLGSEIKHSINYLEIQSMRFSPRIRTMTNEIPAVCSRLHVPRLILQPILENAFQHGLKTKIAGGILSFLVTEQGDRILIEIEDNGEDLQQETLAFLQQALRTSSSLRETTGLLNVHLRLKLIFGEAYGLHVSRGEYGGMKVEVIIPLTNEKG